MKEFFKVTDLNHALAYQTDFPLIGTESIPLLETPERILAEDIISDSNLPEFARSTMDGYAVRAASTFGASEGNPAYLTVKGSISMGEAPDFSIGPGEAAKISTGGMLPNGADSVIMIEHTAILDHATIEIYRSVAPGQHIVEKGEDFRKGEVILTRGKKIRPQETGLLAAFGKTRVKVYKKPVISIISTGDEVIPIEETPEIGQIRDINTYSLSAMVKATGAIPLIMGVVPDDYNVLLDTCVSALEQSDMILISGGSSVGTRDFTIEVLSALPDSHILVHGISISPGKPTILANVRNKAFWGLPGHVVSAMVVYSKVVQPFIEHICGLQDKKVFKVSALLNRNISSVQGRTDYVRVKLMEKDGDLWAEPILGKSGLIHTMIKADGLIEIGLNTEGLDKGTSVSVTILRY